MTLFNIGVTLIVVLVIYALVYYIFEQLGILEDWVYSRVKGNIALRRIREIFHNIRMTMYFIILVVSGYYIAVFFSNVFI